MIPTRLTIWLFVLGFAPLLAGLGLVFVLGPSPFATVLPLLVLGFDLVIFLQVGIDLHLFPGRQHPVDPRQSEWSDRVLPAREEVQVYPNLLEVRRYEALART